MVTYIQPFRDFREWGNTNVVVFPGFNVFPERFGVVGFQPF
jgi:hypothetical protein